jgi:hypothetical protein
MRGPASLDHKVRVITQRNVIVAVSRLIGVPRDHELDKLKAEQDRAFQRKQDAWRAPDDAWKRRQAAREVMDRAYDEKQRAYEVQQEAWEELQRVRDRNGSRIEFLKDRQETAFQNMKAAFERASDAHNARDGLSARMYADEGHRYKAEAQEATAERRQLVQEIHNARDRHDATRPAFQRAKTEFDSARSIHNRTKTDHERAQAEFREAKAEADRAKEAFPSRLTEVRRERDRRKADKRDLANRTGIPYQYRDNVYISRESDGTVNIYFGGLGSPDGPGHGHYAMDSAGNVTYARDPYDAHGSQNFTDHEERPDTAFSEKVRRDGRTQYFFNRARKTVAATGT